MIVGIGGMVGVVVLQLLLVGGALTFAQQVVPVTIAILVIARSLVITGYLARFTGHLPHSLRMSFIAIPYFGYPLWAFWLGRCLLQQTREPVASPAAKAGRHLATGLADA